MDRILRVDAAGEMLTEALPGEEELLQRFSAAFNRVCSVCACAREDHGMCCLDSNLFIAHVKAGGRC